MRRRSFSTAVTTWCRCSSVGEVRVLAETGEAVTGKWRTANTKYHKIGAIEVGPRWLSDEFEFLQTWAAILIRGRERFTPDDMQYATMTSFVFTKCTVQELREEVRGRGSQKGHALQPAALRRAFHQRTAVQGEDGRVGSAPRGVHSLRAHVG